MMVLAVIVSEREGEEEDDVVLSCKTTCVKVEFKFQSGMVFKRFMLVGDRGGKEVEGEKRKGQKG